MRNRIKSMFILVFIFSLILIPSVFARKGVGMVWDTETEIVNEKSKHCVQYKIYNPFDEDVMAVLSVSSNLKEVVVEEKSEATLITAETTHEIAVPVEFCFEIAEVYGKDCLMGNSICEKRCEEPEVSYTGEVIVSEDKPKGEGGAVGSSTSLGVAVPLKLRVKCNPYARDFTLVYAVVIVISLILILWIVYKKRKRKKAIVKES